MRRYFKGKDIISIKDFSREDIDYILTLSEVFEHKKYGMCDKEILATLFLEPSTRTRLSFESAMHRLGGRVISVSDANSSSAKKGERLEHTIKMAENYSDVIVLRHSESGSAKIAADNSDVPVINAGDGTNEHPTQTLTDLYTIKKEFGKIDRLKIGLMGDLKNGRTVHSLSYALSMYNVDLFFISPPELSMPDKYLPNNYAAFKKLDDILADLDILYVTRIQKERFDNLLEYENLKKDYNLDLRILRYNQNIKIMHPLPIAGELHKDFDNYTGSLYFKQAANGVTVRKNLLAMVLGKI